MAKNNLKIHPLLLLLLLIIFIISRIFIFFAENIIPVVTVLGLALVIYLIYYVIKKRSQQQDVNSSTDKLSQHETDYKHSRTANNEDEKVVEKEHSINRFKYEEIFKEHEESLSFIESASDEEIKNYVVKEYPDDFQMQEITYERQADSKSFMEKVSDEEIKKYAIKEYPDNYEMQEYIYKNQKDSKSFMEKVSDEEVKKYVIKEYPDNYEMQEYNYKKDLAIAPNKRQIISRNTDKTIIDINSEDFDLTIDKFEQGVDTSVTPPYWPNTDIQVYSDINKATRAQKTYYTYFKNKVLKGELIDIQGNTNYAFILYYDLLNEYENHRDIKLLEKQASVLRQVCYENKSFLRFLQGDLEKRNESQSLDKSKNLNDLGYQVEYKHQDYDPYYYKLGDQYKEKLRLTKEEVSWLNKFWNPSNVFISIEGCCIATIKQYILILNELNLHLARKETTLAKELKYFINRLINIYSKQYNSEWGYTEPSYFRNRAESDVYLTIFKRIENSVRDSFGHKRKVAEHFPIDNKNLSEEFEIRVGSILNKLIITFNDKINKPDTITQIELNFHNVNRWKIEYNTLKDSFQIEGKNKFIDGINNIEETNQKNPNIEHLFYEASKFIAKHDNIQSLKYYAKYIYYDLKSKKFDNKKLTQSVQKSLFKTDEQINNFKKIIAELIETSDIHKTLDDITKIYIPKRKKIKLNKSMIREIEQKHDGTVELLSEYLEIENDEINLKSSDEEVEISVVPTNPNSSIFISEVNIGEVQEELIIKIVTNSFEIHQDEVDKFATKRGFFKNQLIDSINEACAEHLEGEALIEEDDENYVIEESYYNEIVK